MQELNELRKEIDSIDDLILNKLNERMKLVEQIGKLKQTTGTPIYRPERERAIINRLTSLSKDKALNKAAIEAIYLEIFAVSRNLEMPQKIVYLGPEGTYTHQAAQSRFGAMSAYLPLATIEAVFTKLAQKEAKYGVVPIENNTEGAVGATLDCLSKFDDIKIVAELYVDIHHSFVSINENLKEIKRIYSHPQGYNQCRKFLEDHLLNGSNLSQPNQPQQLHIWHLWIENQPPFAQKSQLKFTTCQLSMKLLKIIWQTERDF